MLRLNNNNAMKQQTSYYSKEELKKIGLKSYGENVYISKKASFYGVKNISIGSNVRIDDFCILSGNIQIGSYIHISAFCALYGKNSIIMRDYSGTSPRVIIFSATDDFGGEYMIGPMVPENLTNITGGPVILEKYVQVGSGSIIMPDVTIHEGAVVGVLSLVKTNLEKWTINAGIPAIAIKNRKNNVITLEKQINLPNK
jgi:galactoside O-acetyltransferase